jgi:hypothetical protein
LLPQKWSLQSSRAVRQPIGSCGLCAICECPVVGFSEREAAEGRVVDGDAHGSAARQGTHIR